MKLKALSHYDNDTDTRFGDCILLFDNTTLVVYDCGHNKHKEAIEAFLQSYPSITHIYIVVSHNDGDHTDGVIGLLERLHEDRYEVTLYSSLYLKSAKKVLGLLDDDRRTLPATKQRILELFDNIKDIVEKAQSCGYVIKDAIVGAAVSVCCIVGPTEDEFVEVVAQAIENGSDSQIDGETVMNAASVQLKCKLVNAQSILLCGDASPAYMHKLNSYDVIQLPHHGKLDSAKAVFASLKDKYIKEYLISDNTGSGSTSGGSDKLVQYMLNECYAPAMNTKKSPVNIPAIGGGITSPTKPQGVKLGEMDFKLW